MFWKKVFLKISKVACRHEPATLFKKRFWHRCFPVNFAKLLRTFFLIEHSRRLLLLSWCASSSRYSDNFIVFYFSRNNRTSSYRAFTCLKSTKETLQKGVKDTRMTAMMSTTSMTSTFFTPFLYCVFIVVFEQMSAGTISLYKNLIKWKYFSCSKVVMIMLVC